MDEAILRHYGLADPFAEKWQDIDTSGPSQSFNTNETDALGTGQPVSSILHGRGIVSAEASVPFEYSLESKTFDARQYIRNVHRKATQNDLRKGQEFLARAIEAKSDSLKGLVEHNFDRFVGSKRVIDNVHAQISSEFGKPDAATHGSRMEQIRGSLNDTSVKAAQIFEPVIENRRKADRLRATLGMLEQYSAQFDLPSVLMRCIEANDNDALLKEYKKGQAMFKEVNSKFSNGSASTTDRRNVRILNRVWTEVERIMRTHELQIWRSLEDQRRVDFEATSKQANLLLEIGVDSNPYYRAYTQHNLRIKEAVVQALARDRVQVEVARRNLQLRHVDARETRLEALTAFVEAEVSPSEATQNIIQSQEVLAFWDTIKHLVDDVWSRQVAAVVTNWKICQEMTNPRSIKLLPNGPDGASKRHHSFTSQEREIAITKAEETVELLCASLSDFFVSKPIREVPSPQDPPPSAVSAIASTSRFEETSALPDMGDREPAEFSFIPVSANSLGACSHLGNIMTTVMTGFGRLYALKISARADEHLQKMMTVLRERCVRAVCELWQADSDDLPFLETWQHASSNATEGTNFPRTLWIVQKAIIDGVARIMYREDLMPAPSVRLLGNVRQQFVKNVYQVINGLMTLAYSASPIPSSSGLPSTTTAATTTTRTTTSSTKEATVEVKKLLTVTNLGTMRSSTLLKLIGTMESTFTGLSLTPDLGKLNDMFAQYSAKLTSSFTAPRMSALAQLAEEGADELVIHHPELHSGGGGGGGGGGGLTDVSAWTVGAVLVCVTAHAIIHHHAPSLAATLCGELMRHVIQVYADLVRRRVTTTTTTTSNNGKGEGGISVDGKDRVTLDLEFLALQFNDTLPREARVAIDDVLRFVDGAVPASESVGNGIGGRGGAGHGGTDRAEIKRILGRAVRRWSTQAQVFRRHQQQQSEKQEVRH